MRALKESVQKSHPDVSYGRTLGIAAVILLFLLHAQPIGEGVRQALSYAAQVLIPSIFPFSVLASLAGQSMRLPPSDRTVQRVCRILKISPSGLGALLIGIPSGFPLGGKQAIDLYNKKQITKDECERLFAMANNPSLGFVIAGVGQGLMGSARMGVLLFIAVLASGYAIGCIGKSTPHKTADLALPPPERLALSDVIRDATMTTVYVVGFVVFFASVTHALGMRIRNDVLRLSLFLLCEVTGACRHIVALSLPCAPRMALLGFALGFGGICVGMQSEVYLRAGGFGVARYYKRKLLQGLLCSALSYLLGLVFF